MRTDNWERRMLRRQSRRDAARRRDYRSCAWTLFGSGQWSR